MWSDCCSLLRELIVFDCQAWRCVLFTSVQSFELFSSRHHWNSLNFPVTVSFIELNPLQNYAAWYSELISCHIITHIIIHTLPWRIRAGSDLIKRNQVLLSYTARRAALICFHSPQPTLADHRYRASALHIMRVYTLHPNFLSGTHFCYHWVMARPSWPWSLVTVMNPS